MKKTIASEVERLMIERDLECAWSGEYGLLDEAYHSAGGSLSHPLDVIRATINALRRSKAFTHGGYIRAMDSTGTRTVNHSCFLRKTYKGKING